MKVVAGTGGIPRLWLSLIFGAVALVSVAAVTQTQLRPALLVCLVVSGLAVFRRAVIPWPHVMVVLLLVILFVPMKRYRLPKLLPIDLEPYRLFVAFIILVWIASLLVDHRMRLRRTGFEGPLGLIVIATMGSEVVNAGRAASLQGNVIKAVSFFISFVLVVYILMSVIRSRQTIDLLVRVLVGGASLVALGALVERRTAFNVFDHLGTVFPFLSFQGAYLETRGGDVRTYASSDHPIELSVVLAILIPLAIYLIKRDGHRRWWLALALLTFGALSSASRTGVVALGVIGAVFLWLRPKETRKLWPLALPAVVAIHFAVPGALGGIKAGFFPQGGLVAEQSRIVQGNQQLANNRLADIGPSLKELSGYNPLLGEGYGTRITGFDEKYVNAAILDDQWLKTLLEIGLLGGFAWLWLFTRSIKRLVRAAREDDSEQSWLYTGLTGSLLALAVSMLTFDMFSFIQVTFLLYILLGLSAAALNLRGQPQRA